MTPRVGVSSDWWNRQALSLLVLLALVSRAGALWHFGSNLTRDPDGYRQIAERIEAGEGFVNPDVHTPTAYRPPLYPLVVAGILRCGGGNTAIGVVQLALGLATVALTVLCGRRLGMGRASLVAGLLVAVDPLLLYQTSLVMTETLATFLAALLLWLCLGQTGNARRFAAGATFGLCCLCRPTFWVFGVLAIAGRLLVWWRTTKSARTAPASHWRDVLSLATGLILVVGPWAMRNALVMGRPILTTTHGGYTLLLPHNPAYTRAVVDQPWGAVWEGRSFNEWSQSLEDRMALERPPLDVAHLTPAVERARDAWMNREAREYIRREPIVAFRAGLTLLMRFWHVVPLTTRDRPLAPWLRLAIGLFYGVLLAAMLFGLVRIVPRGWTLWWPLPTLMAAFTLVHAVYWADMRMRAPLIPAIALLAAVAGTKIRPG